VPVTGERTGKELDLLQDRRMRRRNLADLATLGISILNGFWGDHLQQQDNGLAVAMALYHAGRPLGLTRTEIARAYPKPTAKLCILVHGLSCSESIWKFDRQPAGSAAVPDRAGAGPAEADRVDYGLLLKEDCGYTPFYLRYNSGLAIDQNGDSLASLLDALYAVYPLPVEEIILIGHSMGGLVLRSACHPRLERESAWVRKVTHVFYIGAPHEGASLAKIAHTGAGILHAVPNSITRLVGDVLDLRSQGIKDLQTGSDAPWLPHAGHYLITGAWHNDPEHIASVLLGDGLVHARIAQDEAIPAAHIRAFPGIRHMQLAHDRTIYDQILAWLQPED
jgi:pimeloyl-ACP methyl ester carboxylesterase